MKGTFAFSTVVLLALGLGLGEASESVGISLRGPANPPLIQRVEIVASEAGFTPNEVRVKVGWPVRLVVTSVDVDHRLRIDGLNLEASPNGRKATLLFTPTEAGRYEFRCAAVCGTRHDEMTGTLIVE